MKIKKYLKIGKPSIKGSILVLIGIFNSRNGIGIEIFTNNLIYGPLGFLFLALSGIMIIKLLQILNNPSYKGKISKKGISMIIGTLYIIGFILIIANIAENMIIYYFNIPLILFTVFIGIFWILLGFFGFKKTKVIIYINILIVTLSFSIGLIYGVILNKFIIPVYIYSFFFSISFLQMSRELIKRFNNKERIEEYMLFPNTVNDRKILKASLIFQFSALIFLVLPIFMKVIISYLILFLMILGLITISLASFLTLASLLEKEIYKKISLILKIGILLELITLLVLGI